MSTSTHLITYEESLRMPESSLEEIVDGELIPMPPATVNHSRLLRALQRIFDRQMRSTFDLTWGTGFLLKRDPLRYRIPDLAVVDLAAFREDVRDTSDPYSRVVPELVIEAVSPANRKGDVRRLLENYAEFGIAEVLLFHLDSRTYESYRGIELAATARTGTVSPETMPEVTIDLDRLWSESGIAL